MARASPAHAEPSAAAIASAKSLVAEARALRDKGNHAEARDKLKQAYALVPTPIIGLDLAKEHVALGELIEAREVAVEVTKLPVNPKESSEGKTARNDAAALATDLAKRIPSITVRVSGAGASSVTVVVGKDQVPPDAPYKVNPGTHVVIVSAGSKQKKASVTVAEGETKDVPVAIGGAAASPSASATTPAEAGRPTGGGGLSTLTWIGLGVAGVGVAVGSVTGWMSLSQADSVKSRCTDDFKCLPPTHADYDSSRTLGYVSTVSFVVAGVGAAIATYGLLSRPSRPEAAPHGAWMKPSIGFGTVGVYGAF
ncbi:MAG: tetratricopeptide repeat protein [Deltaproteobacteria bacterium]|nr:tetratricopeptide repeat protein [Deltaproteobacteria bacterium]